MASSVKSGTTAFLVNHVDEGYFEAIPIGNLFQIPPSLMMLLLLTVPVSLAEADQFDRFGTTAADTFCSLALNSTFTAKVPSDFGSTSPQKLQLFDNEGRNVKDLLLAILNPCSNHPTGTTGIPSTGNRPALNPDTILSPFI